MAAPTAITEIEPNLYISITGTDIDAGNNDYTFEYNRNNLHEGFSILPHTLTNITATVLGSHDNNDYIDITTDVTNGSASLTGGTAYIMNVPFPIKFVRLRLARSNATNEVNVTIFAPRR